MTEAVKDRQFLVRINIALGLLVLLFIASLFVGMRLASDVKSRDVYERVQILQEKVESVGTDLRDLRDEVRELRNRGQHID